MTTDQVLKAVAREIRQIGHGWRTNWNDFDGRTLRSQLQHIAEWSENPVGDCTEGSDFHLNQLEWCKTLDEALKVVRDSGGTPSDAAIEEFKHMLERG